jgi:hypothetical protein
MALDFKGTWLELVANVAAKGDKVTYRNIDITLDDDSKDALL